VQCTASADCGPGLFCNVPLGRCESNVRCVNDPSECPAAEEVTCVTCAAPEVCDDRTRRCQAPATPCVNDLDCPGDQLCDVSLPEPICVPRVPDCLDDLLDEPSNDSVAQARALDIAGGPRFEELKLCPANQDWYRLDVVAGTYLTIDARFRHSDGDVELQLFLADGRSLVDESRSTTDNERVEVEVGTDLTLYLRVFVARPTVRPVPYELVVARDPGDLCMDDAGEPDDIRAQARLLEAGRPVEGRHCAGDPDWYVLRGVEAGAHVRLDLDFVDALGDLDLEVLRADGPVPFLVGDSLDDGETVEFDAPYRGDYLVRVTANGADANVYTLRGDVRAGTRPACLDDRLEPNQGITTATPFGTVPTGPQALGLCAGDEDWFLVRLMPGETLTAEVAFDAGVDVDLALYPATITEPDSGPLELSNGISGREYLTHQSFTGGDFLLRVHAPDGRSSADYELRLGVVPLSVCQADAGDLSGRGGGIATAIDLPFPPARLDGLSICSGDTDFYRVFIAGGFMNLIRLSYLVDSAELDFEILDAGGGRLFDSAGALARGTSSKEVTVNVPGAGFGLLYLRVYTNGPFETPYHLNVDLQPIYSCFPDRAEPNETPDLASLVASATVSPVRVENLSLCASQRGAEGGDVDWHRITPPRVGARIEARIDFPQGDLSLELLSPGGARRACANGGADRCFSDGSGLSERVTFTATTTAPYLLRVGSVYSSPQAFIRPAEADAPYDLTVTYGP
jgi:hypothetical protein